MVDISSRNPILSHISAVVEADPRIIAMAPFGSFVREETYRDIDICLFLADNTLAGTVVYEYTRKYGDPFEFHVFSQLPLYIRQRAIKEGHFVVLKNYDQIFDLVVRTINEYVDFEPRLKLILGI